MLVCHLWKLTFDAVRRAAHRKPKFQWGWLPTADARQQILGLARLGAPQQTLNVVEDEPDNRILECAIAAGSEFLISADRDLLRLGNYHGISNPAARRFPASLKGTTGDHREIRDALPYFLES